MALLLQGLLVKFLACMPFPQTIKGLGFTHLFFTKFATIRGQSYGVLSDPRSILLTLGQS